MCSPRGLKLRLMGGLVATFFHHPSCVDRALACRISLNSNPVSAEQRVPFSVFYAGVEIGTYAITAFDEGKQRRLETSTNLRVAFGPITLHRLRQTTRVAEAKEQTELR